MSIATVVDWQALYIVLKSEDHHSTHETVIILLEIHCAVHRLRAKTLKGEIPQNRRKENTEPRKRRKPVENGE